MYKRLTSSIVTAGLLVALFPLSGQAAVFNPHYLLSDAEMEDIFAMRKSELEAFLREQGALADLSFTDLDGVERTGTDIIWNAAMEFTINPQFLLVLLQREQSLVTADTPTQKQLDWALGYAVCDDCSMDDPRIQKFKGFPNQVHYAAKRIRESYLVDLERRGYTISGVGPLLTEIIDGTEVTPANFATAVLYTYTPHLHGNENFVKIWQRWFVRDYPSGSLLQDASTGGIWLIQFGRKRPITSQTAFLTRYNPENVITVQPTILEAYTIGDAISFPNYSLLKAPDNTVYLLVDDTIRAIESMEAFRAIGFNEDEITNVLEEDLEPYKQGPVISTDTVFPQGKLLQDASTGGVWFVENGKKSSIFSRQILDQRFPNWPINTESSDVLERYTTSDPVLFPDGTLVAAEGSPDVFVISEGKRRWIRDEDTFMEYGWEFPRVVWTNERSVLLHPLGEDLTLDVETLPHAEDPEFEVATLESSHLAD